MKVLVFLSSERANIAANVNQDLLEFIVIGEVSNKTIYTHFSVINQERSTRFLKILLAKVGRFFQPPSPAPK
mgnify:FL=1